jgi:hypothetical protein
MAYKRKTYEQKFETPSKAELKETDKGLMVIPAVRDYDELMKKVPKGSVTTVTEIRQQLARKYHADFCCPLVSGIFVNIVAGKAEEDTLVRGVSTDQITFYWRTLRTNGELNPKFPGGVEAHAAKLVEEGLEIGKDKKGRLKRVEHFETHLFKF